MDEQIKGQCYVCGEPLEWEEGASNCFLNDYMGEEGESYVKEVRCPNCGTLYQHYITEDNNADAEDDYISCGDQGFGKCVHCGGTVVWSGDFMRSDYFDDPSDDGEHLDEDDDSIVRSLTCGHCGCSIEAWEPTPNEMKSGEYPYWDGYNEGEVQEKVQ